jgi:hypothetical protein
MPQNMVKSAAIAWVAMFGIGLPSPSQAQILDGGAPARVKVRTLDQELLDGLHDARLTQPASVPEQAENRARDNPLMRTAELMRVVEGRLARHDTSSETQALQRQIVAALAKLLATGDQQPANASSSSAGSERDTADIGAGGIPSREPSADGDGTERRSLRHAERMNARDVVSRAWGDLPDKLRDQMQSTLQEQFLPKYERVIEDYYRRLAEEPVTRP